MALLLIPWLWPGRLAADPVVSTPATSLSHTKTLELGDPIAANSGAYFFTMPLLDLGGPLPLRYELDYHMHGMPWGELDYLGIDGVFQNRNLVQFMERWTDGDEGAEAAVVYLRNGDFPRFSRASAADPWRLDAGMPIRYAMQETGETFDEGFIYVLDPIRATICIFDKAAMLFSGPDFSTYRIVAQVDRNGNRLTYTYLNNILTKPRRVEDGLGRSLDFTYTGMRLTNVTDQAGRSITLKPGTQHGLDVLNAIVDAEGRETSFTYADNAGPNRCVTAVTRPLGNVPYRQTVAGTNLNGRSTTRVASQTDAYGNTTTLAYATNANRVTEARPDGQTVAYEHQHNDGVPKALTDPTGKAAAFSQTVNEQVNAITDRLGDTTTMTYHPASGHLTSLVNAKGGTVTWTYVEQEQTLVNPVDAEEVTLTFHNLVRVDYPDGTFETFTHDARGNVVTVTDRVGATQTHTYNARGQVLTSANPAGGVVAYTYNPDATLATATDSDTGVTTYGYDAYKRVNRVDYPDGSFSLLAYDLNDRVTLLTNENGHGTAFAYDANGNLVKATDPEGAETRFEYDLMDRLVKVTNRLGQETTQAYDAMNRLAEIADATGVKVGFQYDPRGWRDRVTRAGKTWTTVYDDEGVPASRTTPLGMTTVETTDKLGLLQKVRDPLNQETVLGRDAMGRIVAVTDPRGKTTHYAYDAAGRLAGVTLPTGESVAYAYNALGALERLADCNRNLWVFAYTAMGRFRAITDPLDRVTQYAYDTQGRMDLVTYPDAGTQAIAYDAVGNVTGRVYSGAAGPNLAFTYDTRNRLIAANDIAFARDAEGRITATESAGAVCGASYDAAGRLVAVTYPAAGSRQAFAVTYTYDVGTNGTGLLTGVADSLTGTQIAFGYDDDRRLRTVALPNGETITTTWDNADRLARLQSGDHVDVTLTLDPAGRIAVAGLIAPLTPSSFSPQTSSFSFDAAAQLTGPDFAYDHRGRLTQSTLNLQPATFSWDGASRLIGTDAVTLAYNGLGQLRTRTAAGASTRFHYNHAIGMAPIVAEQNADSGQMLRYYVWTPGGRLLYMIDAADRNKVSFYHFDQVGSTLALTDINGDVTDAYTYDPYGRILARTGANPQPFTFVGAWGVRQEGDGGVLYQMRARYYDAATARFLSPEPIWPQLDDPKALNPYQYAGAAPVRFIDPTGQNGDDPLENKDYWDELHKRLMAEHGQFMAERERQEKQKKAESALTVEFVGNTAASFFFSGRPDPLPSIEDIFIKRALFAPVLMKLWGDFQKGIALRDELLGKRASASKAAAKVIDAQIKEVEKEAEQQLVWIKAVIANLAHGFEQERQQRERLKNP
jgi:RHS repeat-associated protein